MSRATDLHRVPLVPVLFLRCCPHWMLKTEMIREVSRVARSMEDGNLSAYYSPSHNPMTTALNNSAGMYLNGYNKGREERRRREKQ
jgi:hypothetical protein